MEKGFIKTAQSRLKERGIKRTIKDLLALAPMNDPFYAEEFREQAEWFVNMWNERGGEVHLRGFHYRLSSSQAVKKTNSEMYENTDDDWNYLLNASKYARYLDLLPEVLEDHKHPEIDENLRIINVTPRYNNKPIVLGYGNNAEDEEYIVEIWIEKSSFNKMLKPLCRELRINFQQLEGTASLIRTEEFMDRIYGFEKPARIFYMSDLDPVGVSMAKEVSRKIEYLAMKDGADIDIKVDPLALTSEQCEDYDLPRAPIKKSKSNTHLYEGKKDKFEATYGRGHTELDAFYGNYPDEFEQVIRDAVEPYRDLEYHAKLKEAEREAEERLKDLMDEHKEELDRIYEGIQNKMVWPERPDNIVGEEPKRDWLYDSGRGYIEQLRHYKKIH